MDNTLHTTPVSRTGPKQATGQTQRSHAEAVVKAAAQRAVKSLELLDDSGGDPYNTAERRLPKNTPWAHLTRKD